MKTLTIFTPTFNRAYCLGQLYESLVKQTSQDFNWLIVDDGSSDHTKELVENWISEEKVTIKYVFKKNGGMHTAHNLAYSNIETPLNLCIDSDDFMPEDAVQKILDFWNKANQEKYAGIIGLDADKNGQIIGTKIPEHLRQTKLSELYLKHGVTGDKKVVLRTDLVKKYPKYPEFEDEKLVPLGILYLMIDQDYDFLCLNEVLCIVEYLADGSSNTIFNQYKKSPKGFRYSRLVEMKYSTNWRYSFTRAMHFISSSIFAKDFHFFKDNPKKILTLLAIPFGIILHLYLIYKIKNESTTSHK